MLTHQIVTRVQSLTEDTAYWTSARIKALINQCKDEISNHFGILLSGFNEFDSVVAQQSYMIPADFRKLEVLYWNNGTTLTQENFTTPKYIAEISSDLDETGTPEYWYLWGKYDKQELWFYPTFDAVYTVQMWYWRDIPDIVNDNDEPLVPKEWHSEIAEYCRRQIWLEDETRNYSQNAFDVWWESRLLKMQSSQIVNNDKFFYFGNFDNMIPSTNDGANGFPFRINSGDGVKW